MRPKELLEAGSFHTSSYSTGGNCVEVGRAADGTVVVRDSKDPRREVALLFSKGEWTAFVLGVKNLEFEP